MPRRVSLPAADELFRSTGGAAVQPSTPPEHASSTQDTPRDGTPPRVPGPAGEQRPPATTAAGEGGEETAGAETATERSSVSRDAAVPGQGTRAARSRGKASGGGQESASRRGRAARRPSGRERHDEKITVYVSAEELMDLEHARLVLRGEHGLAVDRGRIVREAVAVVLADLESRGEASILVRRLRGR
ncbi:hypothetical protein ACTWP5_27160 [Streptomyces sp. 4N509B]|uniref:hypothetical protein n=1 Tax=Streptomyces sp. 4N509B TaxID=3457413 RepID=UPI003FD54616